MEKKKNWLDTYLTPAKELVGYECYVSCDYEDKFATGKFFSYHHKERRSCSK